MFGQLAAKNLRGAAVLVSVRRHHFQRDRPPERGRVDQPDNLPRRELKLF